MDILTALTALYAAIVSTFVCIDNKSFQREQFLPRIIIEELEIQGPRTTLPAITIRNPIAIATKDVGPFLDSLRAGNAFFDGLTIRLHNHGHVPGVVREASLTLWHDSLRIPDTASPPYRITLIVPTHLPVGSDEDKCIGNSGISPQTANLKDTMLLALLLSQLHTCKIQTTILYSPYLVSAVEGTLADTAHFQWDGDRWARYR